MTRREQAYLLGEIVVAGRVEQARACVDPDRATLLQRLLDAPPPPVVIITGDHETGALAGLLGQGVAGLVLPPGAGHGILIQAAARSGVPTLRAGRSLAPILDGLFVHLDCRSAGKGRLILLASAADDGGRG